MEQKELVPISHYFPKKIKILDKNKTKYYYPSKRKYLRLDVIKLYLNEDEVFDWMTEVIFDMSPADKFSYEWFSRYITEFYSLQDKYSYAKDYLIRRFIKDLKFFRDNFSKHNNKIYVHREDLVKFWYENHYQTYGIIYDFSKVLEIVEYHDKLSIVCLNRGPDGNVLGECSSIVNYFFQGRLMESRTFQKLLLRGWKIKPTSPKNILERHNREKIINVIKTSSSFEEVLRKLGETRSGGNSTHIKKFINDEKIDISHFRSIVIEEYYKSPERCPICGKPLPYTSSNDRKRECCCKECSLELKRRREFEKFVKRSNKVHGNSYEYKLENYTNSKTKMLIHDKLFDEDFYQVPHNHMAGVGNPTRNMSSGERLVYLWLSRNNLLNFTKFQYVLDGQIQGVNTMRVVIDFQILYEGKEYWVEYNGEQHYVFRPNGIFTRSTECQGLSLDEQISLFYKHVARDFNVRDYCLSHDITFIEIPYTRESYTSIGKILESVILNGKDPKYIKLPKIRIVKK